MSKILAIDYGTKNIGLALSDDTQKLAFQYDKIEVKDNKQVIQKLKNICEQEDVKQVIIGLPINLSGLKTKTTEKVESFIKSLKQNLPPKADQPLAEKINIKTIDERLSTQQALKIRKNKKIDIDELSAQILLQSYLDKN